MYSEIFLDVVSTLAKLGKQHGQGDLLGEWENKKPWNVPGPLYTGDVDNSGPGHVEAPNNILMDEEGFPFLYRQPVNMFELRQVLLAADHDPFRNYGADGNEHWNLASIREWWLGRAEARAFIQARQAELWPARYENIEYAMALDRWRNYLDDGTELYLRFYAFFLEEGRIPQPEDSLPML